MTLRRTTIALGTALAVLGSGVAMAQTKPAIRLGAIMPMTGFGATYGDLFYTGIAMGVDDVNAKGGVSGSKIETARGRPAGRPAVGAAVPRCVGRRVRRARPVSGTSWENVRQIANSPKAPASISPPSRLGVSSEALCAAYRAGRRYQRTRRRKEFVAGIRTSSASSSPATQEASRGRHRGVHQGGQRQRPHHPDTVEYQTKPPTSRRSSPRSAASIRRRCSAARWCRPLCLW